MFKLVKRGTLLQRANAHNRLTNATLLGSLEGEEFKDVEVVTLSQYAKDCAYREVLEAPDYAMSYEDVETRVEGLLETRYHTAKEFISIDSGKIMVGINAEQVDQRAMDKAMLLLVELEDFNSGDYHTFGDPVTLNL